MSKPPEIAQPWFIDPKSTHYAPRGYVAISSADHTALALVVVRMEDEDEPNAELLRHANLIAAAPALLAEVKRLQAESDQLCADMLGVTVAQLVAACEKKPGGDRLRTLALIANAEGRS